MLSLHSTAVEAPSDRVPLAIVAEKMRGRFLGDVSPSQVDRWAFLSRRIEGAAGHIAKTHLEI